MTIFGHAKNAAVAAGLHGASFFRASTLKLAAAALLFGSGAAASANTAISSDTVSLASVAADAATPAGAADAQYRALFQSWKKLDQIGQGVIAIPSEKPVAGTSFTSGFGVRSDPFKGGAAMHAGVDLAGPKGTPIYATADGYVGRAEWANGYGNLVELNHGKGIQTRYGHLSKLIAKPNSFVKRGQLIGLMGSTGRSTGSHLHYEVRIDGRAVNPIPFLQSADYVMSVQRRVAANRVALGGPE